MECICVRYVPYMLSYAVMLVCMCAMGLNLVYDMLLHRLMNQPGLFHEWRDSVWNLKMEERMESETREMTKK
jgi:hypothetical protein